MNAPSAYRHGQGENASPIRLIILLYEQLIADLRLTVYAIQRGDIESRTGPLSHALTVLGELEAALNKEAGADVAQNLGRFYQVLRAGLLQVQFHPDTRALERHISNLLMLREAWLEVERQQASSSQGVPPAQVPASPSLEAPNELPRSDWRV